MRRSTIRRKATSRIPKEITEEYLDDLEMRMGCERFTVDDDELMLAKERGLGSWMGEDLKQRFNKLLIKKDEKKTYSNEKRVQDSRKRSFPSN